MKPASVIVLAFFLLALFPLNGSAGISSFLEKLGMDKNTQPLNQTKIGQGLKEALSVGIDKAIALTGRKDGYLANPNIRIPLPEKVGKAEGILRRVGFGPKLDEFIVSMNRSAENAAPHAKNIFIEAIASMSIEDAEKLLKGGDTAATEYFRGKTSDKLVEIYKPIVEKTMNQYGVTKKYKEIGGRYQSTPFASQAKFPDVESYVVQKSLDGLFYTLGEQEKLIRQEPSARVTGLLKEVFSNIRK